MLLMYLVVLAIAVAFHEIGHILYFSSIDKEVKFKWRWKSIFDFGGETTGYGEITDEQHMRALWSGVILGFIPIFLLSWFDFMLILLTLPYVSICWTDLKEINKLYGKKGQNFMNLKDGWEDE